MPAKKVRQIFFKTGQASLQIVNADNKKAPAPKREGFPVVSRYPNF